jgi:hypothetical protein
LVATIFISCRTPTAPSSDLHGGIVVIFAVGTEQFSVFVTNAQTIAHLFALRDGTGVATIPNARIHRGAGAGNHNAPYSWYLDPADIEMAPVTIELCDGRPSYVQNNVGEYVDVVKRYCPWGARLVKITDYR